MGHTPPLEEWTLENALAPRQLFHEEDKSSLNTTDLTEESSDDEVFIRKPEETQISPKLRRRNAIRRPRRQHTSEPRVTRDMLRSNRYESVSCPVTPSAVDLGRTQNLTKILKPRNPIVPEAVSMDEANVQTLKRALDACKNTGDTQTRDAPVRTSRKKKIDYLHLHKYGKQ